MLITDYDRLTSEYTGLRLTVLKIHTVTDSPHFPTPYQAFLKPALVFISRSAKT